MSCRAALTVVPLLALAVIAHAADGRSDPAPAAPKAPLTRAAAHATAHRVVVAVAHAPVTTSTSRYVDAAPAGPSAGDVRAYDLPLTRRGGHRRIGDLTGTLTTVAVDRPRAGMELRTADLVFVVGRPADQLVLGGVAAYAQTTPTISRSSAVTRPVLGGSGRYAGARGSCVSTHRADGTWTHVFRLTLDR